MKVLILLLFSVLAASFGAPRITEDTEEAEKIEDIEETVHEDTEEVAEGDQHHQHNIPGIAFVRAIAAAIKEELNLLDKIIGDKIKIKLLLVDSLLQEIQAGGPELGSRPSQSQIED